MPDLPVSENEYSQRLKATRLALQQLEIDVAIFMSPEIQYWLTGYDTFLGAQLPQALILTPGSDNPTLAIWDADVAIAQETTLIDDVQTYRFGVEEPEHLFSKIALGKIPRARRIALDSSSQAMTYGFGIKLAAALQAESLIDVTQDLARLRSVKSSAEIELMRTAGRHARAGLTAAKEHLQAGMTEIQLAGEIEYAMRNSGSDYFSIPTELTSGSRSVLGHGTPKNRVLESGDIVHVEIGGVERRYNCIGIQTLVVPGCQPKKSARNLYAVALDCLRAGLDTLRPGIEAREVEAPALRILSGTGLGGTFKMRFGYGVGIGYPPTWLEPLKITRTSTDILEPGNTFVLHACLVDEAEQIGVLIGGTYLMTPDGYELISGAGDVELS